MGIEEEQIVARLREEFGERITLENIRQVYFPDDKSISRALKLRNKLGLPANPRGYPARTDNPFNFEGGKEMFLADLEMFGSIRAVEEDWDVPHKTLQNWISKAFDKSELQHLMGGSGRRKNNGYSNGPSRKSVDDVFGCSKK